MTTTHPAPTENVETRHEGTFGIGIIRKLPTGGREITVEFNCGITTTAESTRVDLDAMGATTLDEAVKNAVETFNRLALFEKTSISGSKALVICFRRPTEPDIGYATIIKKGVPSLRFDIARIDLEAMKAPNIMKALRKVAWETGSVKLKK